MIKAIFFDIDGTLISSKTPYIKQNVIDGLKQLHSKGIKLFIASGRSSIELEELHILHQFNFDGYLLLNGGYCLSDHKLIYNLKIDEQDVKEIIKVVEEKNYPCMFIENDKMYINFVNERVKEAQASINTSIPPVQKEINVTNIYQIDPFVSEDEINEIVKNTKNVKVTKWHDYAYDIVPKDGGKSNAIKSVQSYYHYRLDEMMAFGDGHNDIEMFNCVGYSVAMGNSSDEVKQNAVYVCDSVDNTGIEDGLKHFKLI